jgi:hypothetical protein
VFLLFVILGPTLVSPRPMGLSALDDPDGDCMEEDSDVGIQEPWDERQGAWPEPSFQARV